MADVFTPKKRSEVMSKIRSKNTKPELLVRRFLFSQGFRFRLHQATLPGRPDIVLKKFNSIIFVNGCFWHGHKKCKYFNMPTSRVDYWIPKIENNIYKDKDVTAELRKLSWNVFTIWECQLKENKAEKTLTALVNRILRATRHSS
jgi:DNA mismatch endonuclease (patch repair protein)